MAIRFTSVWWQALFIFFLIPTRILRTTSTTREIPRNKIGYLPEERGLYKNVKVMDILLYLAELKDYPLNRAKERTLEYLEKFGLEGKDKVSVEELSKGMGQKVQFIASILHELDHYFSCIFL